MPWVEKRSNHRGLTALAALALFQEAARQDRLTVETTLEVAAYLREARHEPGRCFAWSQD